MKLAFLGFFLSVAAHATIPVSDGYVMPFQRKNYPLKELVKDYADALKINLSYGSSFAKETYVTDLHVHSKTSFADFTGLVKSILDGRSYTIIDEGGYFWISPTRDIRYLTAPVFVNSLPPADESYYTTIINLNHHVGQEIARNMRPFMSRYGRILDLGGNKVIILVEKGETASNIQSIVKFMDNPKLEEQMMSKEHFMRAKSEFENILTAEEKEKMLDLEIRNKVLEKRIIDNQAALPGGIQK